MSIIPLFKSHYSIGKSILTLEKSAEITDSSPISIFSIAKKHDLKEITLVEDSISGFIQAYSYAKEMGIKPGSPEFHALKGKSKSTGKPSNGNGNGNGKGNGNGNGKKK